MDLRELKYFLATAESGQVSRAANALAISQSSVTAAVRRLEDELGAPLFQRTASGMELTDAGRELRASAQDILDRLERARHITHRQSAVTGTISIAASYTVMGYFLPYHLDRLHQLFPGLDIRPSEQPRESIEEGLLSNRFDMAVMLTSNTANPDLETETLFRSRRRLWVPNNHRFHQAGRVSFADIASEDYIMLTVDEAAQTAMKYWSVLGMQPKVKLRTSSTEAVRSMVANGQGITILSDMVYRPWSLEGKRIGTVQTEREVPTMDVGLAWRKGMEISGPLAVFHDYFRHAFLSPQSPAVVGRG
ncbi:MAG: LysR family transcriptional regulator [Pseudooceanicola sp.]|jgi:DNA-binding transcriptional LysR family regulator|nr:LysR family transcriptional regulator [Pseudooceanicola sp.]